jgi:hypothetical protein
MNPRTLSCLLVAASAALTLVACGDKVIIKECPIGTEPQGADCVPFGTADAQAHADPGGPGDPGGKVDRGGLADLPVVFPDVGPLDPGAALDPGTASDPATPPDPGGAITGEVGSHCALTSDCDGGATCLNWPGGYCALLECTPGSCPGDARCVELPGGNKACLAACTTDADCLDDGTQACKPVAPGFGEDPLLVCHGVATGAGGVGALCQDDAACAGAATCLGAMPGGYCAIEGCTAGSCPAGAACVKFDGELMCLQACNGDGDCQGGPGAERQCADLRDTANGFLPVCVSAVAGLAIGERCQSGVECTSGYCRILGEGRCSQTDTPCFTEADCNGAEFCTTGPQFKVGLCTSICAVGKPCPGASACAGEPGAPQGECRPLCSGLTDTATCRADDGFSCVFGYTLGNTTGQGQYVCHSAAGGGLGSGCAADGDCASGQCSDPGGAGVCVDACTLDLYCPFPGTCVSGPSADPTCWQACFTVADCPAAMQCTQPAGSLRKVCLP